MAKPTDDREMPRDIVIVVDQDSDDPSQRRIHLSYPARGGLEFANDLMRRWLMIGPDLAATTFSAWFEQRTALPLRASVHFGEGTHDDPLVSIKLGVSGEAQQTAAKMLYLALYTIKDKIQHLPEEHQATVAETVQRGFDILQRGTELTDDVLQQFNRATRGVFHVKVGNVGTVQEPGPEDDEYVYHENGRTEYRRADSQHQSARGFRRIGRELLEHPFLTTAALAAAAGAMIKNRIVKVAAFTVAAVAGVVGVASWVTGAHKSQQRHEEEAARTREAEDEQWKKVVGAVEQVVLVEDERTGELRPATEDELAQMAQEEAEFAQQATQQSGNPTIIQFTDFAERYAGDDGRPVDGTALES